MQWGWGWGGCLFVTTGAGHKGYGVELLERGGRGSEKSQKLRYGMLRHSLATLEGE